MSTLPALPSIANAKIPVTYSAAKAALAKCVDLDECQDWADKAAALASYARQAEDQALLKMATRIRARAIQRCGELLKQIQPQRGVRAAAGPNSVTRQQAATDAGLSSRQRKTALRVATLPKNDFEAAVESEDPPSVAELAERGTQKCPKPLIDLQGRNPEDFKISTHVQAQIAALTDLLSAIDLGAAVRGAFPKEREQMMRHVASLNTCLMSLRRLLMQEINQ